MGSILVGAAVSGSIYSLVSLGFALAFRVSSVFNMAHGIVLVAAGYFNYWLCIQLGLTPWLSIPSTLICVSTLGFLIEAVLIPTAKSVGLTTVDLLILSWLLLLIMQDILAISSNSQSIYIGSLRVQEGFPIFGGRITTLQFAIILTSVAAALVLSIVIRIAPVWQEIMAIGDDQRLATIYGLNVRKLISLNALLAALLTASAGILLSYEQRLDPTLGFRFSVIGIVATLIGRPLGPVGAILGAYALALFETLVLYAVNPGLRDAAVYSCLIVVVAWTYRRSLVPVSM
jgi:branched-chain amino acid transport system permease protein